ncbi:post-transcriptional regulator [Priestia taiwanensis]|uniref:Histidine kinase n=1 Tax=Priestia taiwanensis TaxID=1347902 RepID=A0A917AW86_9BACI|nr:post-transcriptional regulator [Priestia taiwanensis]MBM7363643.1 phosphoenolpyruvate synthase/pyruvate phosphate dikinase [Priestia taiwanensis]GGE75347.1 histidine kinase [Priestia taiwanensis]
MKTAKEHPVDKHRDELAEVIMSKVEEFHFLGYDRVTVEEIWDCLKKKKWKKYKEDKLLHQLVNDVLSLSPSEFMNYLTIEAQNASPEWFFKDYEK